MVSSSFTAVWSSIRNVTPLMGDVVCDALAETRCCTNESRFDGTQQWYAAQNISSIIRWTTPMHAPCGGAPTSHVCNTLWIGR